MIGKLKERVCLFFLNTLPIVYKSFYFKVYFNRKVVIDLILPVVVSNYITNFKIFNSMLTKWYITLYFSFSINVIRSGLLRASSNKLRNLFYILCAVKIRRYFGITFVGLVRLINSPCFICGVWKSFSTQWFALLLSVREVYISAFVFMCPQWYMNKKSQSCRSSI